MKRFIILTSIFAVLLTACDALDTEPLSTVSPSAYFQTESDLQLFSNTFYNNLLDKDPYDEQNDVLVQQTLSDPMYGGSYRTVPNSGGGWTWTNLRKMNTLLGYIDQCSDEDAVIEYTALTRFFRAYFYYEKVKRFGDVPWYETELGSDSEELYKARDTREYVMTKMLEDIDYAIENLGDNTNVFRADKWAALALKSQFCLFEGTYRKYHDISYDEHDYTYYLEQCAEASQELMEEGGFSLYSTGNPYSDYLTLFAEEDANTDEYIFAIDFDYSLAIYHNATGYTVLSTQGRPGLTRKFINTYLMADGTKFTDKENWQTMQFAEETADRDPRLSQSIRTPGYTRIGETETLNPDFSNTVTGYQPVKFVQDPDDSGGNVDRVDRSTCDLPVYRYAEVLLNYAEAKAELGTLTQGDLDISVNLIRARAGMPDLNMATANANPDWYLASSEYGYSNVTGTNQGVILEIRRERGIELLMEGFRWEDLMRWAAGSCKDQPIVGMYFPGAGEYDLNGDGTADIVLYTDANTSTSSAAAYKIGTDILLSEDTSGYVFYHKNADITAFNEIRDYLYPIPIEDRSLNPNLTQNPGWDDGLDY